MRSVNRPGDLNASLLGEFIGIAQQVHHDMRYLVLIGVDLGRLAGHPDAIAAVFGQRFDFFDASQHQVSNIKLRDVKLGFTRLEPGVIEDLIDLMFEIPGTVQTLLQKTFSLFRLRTPCF